MNNNTNLKCLRQFIIPLLVLSLFSFKILFAAQTNYYYIAKEKTWQENETAHGHVTLQEQSDDDLKISECAYYCTARDGKFE